MVPKCVHAIWVGLNRQVRIADLVCEIVWHFSESAEAQAYLEKFGREGGYESRIITSSLTLIGNVFARNLCLEEDLSMALLLPGCYYR